MKTPSEFKVYRGSEYMLTVTVTHLIQTSPFSRPMNYVLEEVVGGGEEEVEEEEHWGQEALF